MSDDPAGSAPTLDRRQLLVRSAVIGGTVVWASPVIQSIASPAAAASVRSECSVNIPCWYSCNNQGSSGCVTYSSTDPTICQGIKDAYCSGGLCALFTYLCEHWSSITIAPCAGGAVAYTCVG